MPPPGALPLPELARKLAAEGPVKHERANRRVRGQLGGLWVFDTLDAEFVWEHPYYPQFYVPLESLEAGPGKVVKDDGEDEGFWSGTLHAGDKSAPITVIKKGVLQDLVKIAADSLDAWFAEDEKLLSHPKDPYKRIECLPSTREVRIEVDGTVVARSSSNVFLHETMLRTRYYLAPTAVADWAMLHPSDTSSVCPYKGTASYYHVRVGDRQIDDAVWYYVYPTAESAMVQGRLCFYNEKVDVFVDGKKEDK